MEPTNPYTARPISGQDTFVGREQIVRQILRALHGPQQSWIKIQGQRRIGKTSLLNAIKMRLQARGVRVVWLDCQHWTPHTLLSEVLLNVSSRLGEALEAAPPTQQIATETHRWLHEQLCLLPDGARLVFLIDEFDALITAPHQPSIPHVAFWQRLFAHERVDVVCSLGSIPSRDAVPALQLLKDFTSRPLSLFTPPETIALIRLSERQPVSLRWSDAAVSAAQELTSGHPYLTQQLCDQVWERTVERGTPVRPEDVHAAIPETLQVSQVGLDWLWAALDEDQRVLVVSLAVDGPAGPEEVRARLPALDRSQLAVLQRAGRALVGWGLLANDQGPLRFRVELIRQWIALYRSGELLFPSAVAGMAPRALLAVLLQELFSKAELRMFLAEDVETEELVHAIAFDGSLRAVAGEAADLLERSGLIQQSLFVRLIRARPAKRSRIAQAAEFICSRLEN